MLVQRARAQRQHRVAMGLTPPGVCTHCCSYGAKVLWCNPPPPPGGGVVHDERAKNSRGGTSSCTTRCPSDGGAALSPTLCCTDGPSRGTSSALPAYLGLRPPPPPPLFKGPCSAMRWVWLVAVLAALGHAAPSPADEIIELENLVLDLSSVVDVCKADEKKLEDLVLQENAQREACEARARQREADLRHCEAQAAQARGDIDRLEELLLDTDRAREACALRLANATARARGLRKDRKQLERCREALQTCGAAGAGAVPDRPADTDGETPAPEARPGPCPPSPDGSPTPTADPHLPVDEEVPPNTDPGAGGPPPAPPTRTPGPALQHRPVPPPAPVRPPSPPPSVDPHGDCGHPHDPDAAPCPPPPQPPPALDPHTPVDRGPRRQCPPAPELHHKPRACDEALPAAAGERQEPDGRLQRGRAGPGEYGWWGLVCSSALAAGVWLWWQYWALEAQWREAQSVLSVERQLSQQYKRENARLAGVLQATEAEGQKAEAAVQRLQKEVHKLQLLREENKVLQARYATPPRLRSRPLAPSGRCLVAGCEGGGGSEAQTSVWTGDRPPIAGPFTEFDRSHEGNRQCHSTAQPIRKTQNIVYTGLTKIHGHLRHFPRNLQKSTLTTA